MATPKLSPTQLDVFSLATLKKGSDDAGTGPYFSISRYSARVETLNALDRAGVTEFCRENMEHRLTPLGVELRVVMRFARGLHQWRWTHDDVPQEAARKAIGVLGMIPVWQAAVDAYFALTTREKRMLLVHTAGHGWRYADLNPVIIGDAETELGTRFGRREREEFTWAFNWLLFGREEEEREAAEQAAADAAWEAEQAAEKATG